jgi:hypothetical protein
MSAVPKIIEGTWEEVFKRAKELEGHRLKVFVLDAEDSSAPDYEVSAEEWVRRLRDWAYNRPPVTTVVDDSRQSIYKDRLE